MPKANETEYLVTLPGGGRLRGDAAASYLRMRADGMPAGGVDVFYRSLANRLSCIGSIWRARATWPPSRAGTRPTCAAWPWT